MAYIYFDSAKTMHVLSDQDTLIRELNSLMNQVDSVRTNLRYKIACRATISARLQDTARQIGLEAQRSAHMRDAFNQIIALYQQVETKNLGLLQADKTTVQQGNTSVVEEATREKPLDELFDFKSGRSAMTVTLLNLINPILGLIYITSGLAVGKTPSFTNSSPPSSEKYSQGPGFESSKDSLGVTAWLGKAGASAHNEWGYAEANGYAGKAKAEVKADAGLMQYQKKLKKKDGKWTEKETLSYIYAEAKAGASVSALAGDAKAGVGTDMLGAEGKVEGSVGNATAEGKVKVSAGDDGVTAVASGKAIVSAVEGKATGTINILGLEIKGTIGGYAGGAGVEGKIGIEDGHFVMEGGLAALVGIKGGVEVGFNDEGWNNFIDFITFWD